MVDQSKNALKRFELENNIEDENIYKTDEATLNKLIYMGTQSKDKPWKKNPEHFQKVKISAIALIKMSMHARSGGDIEVMGSLQGFPVGDTMYIMDVFGLPVVGTETRVNAAADCDQFMIDH